MRVLFVSPPGVSHLAVMVPLAHALRTAGHEVRVASHPELAGHTVGTGLPAVVVGEPADQWAWLRSCAGNETIDRMVDPLWLQTEDEHLHTWIRNYLLMPFCHYFLDEQPGTDRRPLLDDLVDFAVRWRPDLVIWDSLSFHGAVAARVCGAAHARILWGLDKLGWVRSMLLARQAGTDAAGPEGSRDPLAEAMRPVLRRFGIEFSEELVTGQWTLDTMPPRMRLPVDLDYVAMRRIPYNGAAELPAWLDAPPGRPRVCLTLGVSAGRSSESGDTFVADLFGAVDGMPLELIATVNDSQLADVPHVPANVRTIDYLPLNVLLPSCSAVVHHGGGGTLAAAVAHRVPQLIAPTEPGDYSDIARFVADRGAGLTARRGADTSERLRALLGRLLDEPSFQAGADALHRDSLQVPHPGDVVVQLERRTAQQHEGARCVS
ncbi:nucleotide disphospho-sugar-binding domain-containing protein [Streptomyces sp. ST2-7A]|uniref:nucleotide disphospho-sugar-binding domain-containing protein n=1 Tax=Streptomyces sp. ST2-7A TaxID=2907214 RepID=UPI001F2B0BB3|nr:nucleotide disphospho-sugar-binding domain-containing protein [Streptomyces sp. ST2-7A]MCE7082455.1 DUF1205 domain-containing protein [Streptomyces sp. ST2-7A]